MGAGWRCIGKRIMLYLQNVKEAETTLTLPRGLYLNRLSSAMVFKAKVSGGF